MNNLANVAHPPWCLRGQDCIPPGGFHASRLINAAPRGNEVFQAAVGLWQMDVGPTTPSGLLLELSVGEDVERWPIDRAQSWVLAQLMVSLLGQAREGALWAA